MARYSIKDMERLSGIKAHTLRIWEKRYDFLKPRRTQTKIRFYSDEDLKKILNIALLNRNGYKISRIAKLTNEEIYKKVTDITNKQFDTKTQVDNLVISTVGLDEKRFDKILNNLILQVGFEETIMHTVYPFLGKIGILWQTGAINPAQEHFITNLIRQKMILAIDGIVESEKPDAKSFLLFLPEGEMHEIGLLFYHYIIKKHGHKVIYLGQSVPFNDITDIMEIKESDILLTTFIMKIAGFDVYEYLQNLSSTFANKKILFSMYEEDTKEKKLPANVIRIKNIGHFKDILNTLD